MQKLLYTTIGQPFEFELPKIKWSRFIGNIFYVQSKDDVEKALQEIKKRHPDANHHCFAYRHTVLANPDIFGNTIISTKHNHSSDDGEPASTAGKPIMQILEKWNISNVLLIGTRYFWWTKLGVGGLIQAYSECAKQTLAHASIREAELIQQVQFAYDFELTQIVRKLLNQYHAKIIEESYDTQVSITIEMNRWYLLEFQQTIKDETKGKIVIDERW